MRNITELSITAKKLMSIDYEKHRFAVYILHLPTGEVGYSDSERSQHKNKIKALEMLEGKIKVLSY